MQRKLLKIIFDLGLVGPRGLPGPRGDKGNSGPMGNYKYIKIIHILIIDLTVVFYDTKKFYVWL